MRIFRRDSVCDFVNEFELRRIRTLEIKTSDFTISINSTMSLLCDYTCARVNRNQPLAVFHLEPHPGGTAMMTVRAKVRGSEGLFLFDTGGGISYISLSFAQTVGCRVWGQITGFTLTGQRLDMPRCDWLAFDVQGRTFNAPLQVFLTS